MGITGLIPFLKKSTIAVNISQYSGQCVAIDAYCWLHKGAYSCIEKLARGEECDAYVVYCMKFVHMLLSHNIKPILVFDGRHLPAKAQTEMKRRESRQLNRDRAAELLRDGRSDEARNFLKRCVDITHGMALALIKECRNINVDCIVAPYEADAQLAYLNMKNIAQLVITEDSDLILFGCNTVMFKMDINGNGLLVEKDKLFLAMGNRPEKFEFEKFRHMCILSGCDYLPSLPGIGLAKALKFVTKIADPDIHRALRHLPSYLNMNNLSVTNDYRNDFIQADATFKYQLVYDPIGRKLVTLTEPPEGYVHNNYAGAMLSKETAYQLALGNLDPFSLKRVDDFNPDVKQEIGLRRTNSWKHITRAPHRSIWDPCYMLTSPQFKEQEVTVKKKVNVAPEVSVALDQTEVVYTSDELRSFYFSKPEKIPMDASECGAMSPSKKLCTDDISKENLNEGNVHIKSRHLLEKKNRNPFIKNKTNENNISSLLSLNLEERTSATENKFSALSKFNLCSKNFQDMSIIVRSKYFKKKEGEKVNEKILQGENNPAALQDLSNIDYSSIYNELKPTLTEEMDHISENEGKSILHLNDDKYVCRDNDGVKDLEKEMLQGPEMIEENLNDKIIDVEGSFRKNIVTEKILDKGTSAFKWENPIHNSPSLLNITNSVSQNFKNPFKKITNANISETSTLNNIEEQSSENVKISDTNSNNSNCKVKKENIKSCSLKRGVCRTQGLRKQGLNRKSLNLHQQNLLSQFGFQKKDKSFLSN